MHVFIAGVMQGERRDDQIESPSYRIRISDALRAKMPDVTIIDPWAMNPDSVSYDDQLARQTFLSLTRRAGEVDLLIAYLPTVSMGTAMEMWQAYQAGVYIIAITPHVHHWAIRFTADKILPDLDDMLQLIENGGLVQAVEARNEVDGG
jgi:hypothetical protein